VSEVDVPPLSDVPPVESKRGPCYKHAKRDKDMCGKGSGDNASLTHRDAWERDGRDLRDNNARDSSCEYCKGGITCRYKVI
jgi:hypothetical protein